MPNELLDRLQSLNASKAAALDAAQGVLAMLSKENRASMTTDEQALFDKHVADATGVQRQIDAVTKMSTVAPTSNIPSDLNPGSTNAGRGAEVYDNHLDKPWGPQASGAETPDQRRKRLMLGFGEYLRAVQVAESKQRLGQRGDARLYKLNDDFERRAQAAGSSEQVPSDGGFLIAPDFSQEIMMLAHETGVIYPRTRKLPLSEYTNAIKIPAVDERSRAEGSRWGGVQVFWESEAASLSGSKPTVALLEMITKKLTGLYYATNEALSDARLLGAIAMQAFGEEFGYKLDDGVIRGTGSGQIMGILNAPCLISCTKEAGQAAATFTYKNAVKMWSRMWNRSRSNAVWFVEQDVEPQLMTMVLETGVGGIPVYTPPGVGGALFGGATEQPYGRLFGRPVVTVEQCSTLGTKGDVILADWSQYLMIDKGDIQSATSMHVRFLTDEQTYRYIYRCDGAPWWKTSITPANGTNTRSPFVCMETR